MRAATEKNNPRTLWDLSKEVAPGFIRLTRRGKLVAYVLLASHYDEEDLGYMTDPSFWKMIEQRKKEPTIPWEQVKARLLEREHKGKNGSRKGKGKRNGLPRN